MWIKIENQIVNKQPCAMEEDARRTCCMQAWTLEFWALLGPMVCCQSWNKWHGQSMKPRVFKWGCDTHNRHIVGLNLQASTAWVFLQFTIRCPHPTCRMEHNPGAAVAKQKKRIETWPKRGLAHSLGHSSNPGGLPGSSWPAQRFIPIIICCLSTNLSSAGTEEPI